MAKQEYLTTNRLKGMFREFHDRYSRMNVHELNKEIRNTRQRLLNLRRTKSTSLLLDMLKDVEHGHPITVGKMNRVMSTIKSVPFTAAGKTGTRRSRGGTASPVLPAIFLTSMYVEGKSIFR